MCSWIESCASNLYVPDFGSQISGFGFRISGSGPEFRYYLLFIVFIIVHCLPLCAAGSRLARQTCTPFPARVSGLRSPPPAVVLLFIVCCLWFIVYCSLFMVYCLFFIVYLLFFSSSIVIVYCLSLIVIVHCSLFIVHCLLFIVYGLWFIVSCVSSISDHPPIRVKSILFA